MSGRGEEGGSRWIYYILGCVVFAPVLYVFLVILLAILAVHVFGVHTAQPWLQALAYPLIWLADHVQWFDRFMEWVSRIFGL